VAAGTGQGTGQAEDNFLHLAIAGAGILAAAASPSYAPGTRAATPSV
jgi:hypothetical protein